METYELIDHLSEYFSKKPEVVESLDKIKKLKVMGPEEQEYLNFLINQNKKGLIKEGISSGVITGIGGLALETIIEKSDQITEKLGVEPLPAILLPILLTTIGVACLIYTISEYRKTSYLFKNK